MKNKITGGYVEELQPKARIGRPPVIRQCPHCHRSFNATEMRGHQPACKLIFQQAPPPAPLPEDLENQILSKDPLERERQLDQQEADRIERTLG